MDLSNAASWLFPISVLGTSLIASPHCLGMCGPLVFAFGPNRHRLVAYHAGRFISYVILGVLAGALGKSVFVISNHPVLSAIFLSFAACLLLFVGWKLYTGKSLHIQLFSGTVLQRASKLGFPPVLSSALTGLLSILLPCGHLYMFVLAATATGSALRGGVMMFAFWLGTLPALGFGLHFFRSSIQKLGPNRYRVAALILVTTGFLSLGTFAVQVLSPSHAHATDQSQPKEHSCH